MLIQGGTLLEGTLCKKTLGAAGGGLVHIIFMEHGPDAARAFLTQCQYTVNYWLLQHSFSIGIGDTVADEDTMLIINQTINQVCWRLISCHMSSAHVFANSFAARSGWFRLSCIKL